MTAFTDQLSTDLLAIFGTDEFAETVTITTGTGDTAVAVMWTGEGVEDLGRGGPHATCISSVLPVDLAHGHLLVRGQDTHFIDGIQPDGLGVTELVLSRPEFRPNAVSFDGSNDYAQRATALTVSDAKTGTLSVWLKRSSGQDGNLQKLLDSENHYIGLTWQADNTIRLALSISGFTSLILTTDTAWLAASGWVHLLASWDLANGVAHLYVLDADDQAAGATINDAAVGYSDTQFTVGAQNTGTNKLSGCMAELWLSTEYVDVSDRHARALFITQGSKLPVAPGTDGSTPTGTAPFLYLRGAQDAWATNAGTGGDLSVTGALSACTGPGG